MRKCYLDEPRLQRVKYVNYNNSCFRKSAHYVGVKIFNRPPSNVTSPINIKAQFKVHPKDT
jgi:hypothetical protein